MTEKKTEQPIDASSVDSPQSEPTAEAPIILPPTPLRVYRDIQLVTDSIETALNDKHTVALPYAPFSIEQVSINGRLLAIGDRDQGGFKAGYQVLYDAKQQSLLFSNDASGFVQVVYTHASETEQKAVHGLIAFLHQRVNDLEGVIQKLRDGGIV